jgi:hypothetical protein
MSQTTSAVSSKTIWGGLIAILPAILERIEINIGAIESRRNESV